MGAMLQDTFFSYGKVILTVVATVLFWWALWTIGLDRVWERFRVWRSHREDRVAAKAQAQLAAQGEKALRGLAHPLLYQFLAWYYGVTLWSCHEQDFPAVVMPVEPALEVGVDGDVLEPWNSSVARAIVPTDLARPERRYVDVRRRAKRRMDNLQTFCLESIRPDGLPVIRGNLVGEYFDMLATCDSLEEELLVAFASHPPQSAQDFDHFAKEKLPLRNLAKAFCAQKSASPYLTGIGRSAALAVSTLTLARKLDGSVLTFIGHRSGKT